ncbi:MAG: bifunctional nuclease family protein [Anaerolineae bacterium]|jgi:bifunctional DNase/RNase
MVEVKIAGIQVNLMSNHRVVLLKEIDSDRYLMIWIGPFEAEAINIKLQDVDYPRPLTHDLMKNVIGTLGAEVEQIVVTDLRDDTFYARIILSVDGRYIDIDARPSDAMALAVRAGAPIFVADEVMDEAGVVPEKDLMAEGAVEDEASAFDDFLDDLDIDDLPIH